MSEKKIDVFYQAPGEKTWRHVEEPAKVRAKALRRSARVLLVQADAAAERLISVARPPTGLTPVEAFERQMAAALGAWGRFMAVEVKRFERTADAVLEDLLGKRR